MTKRIRQFLTTFWPIIVVLLLGIAGTGLYRAGEGVYGSPYVNQPGTVSFIDEGEHLEWTHRVLHGQIPYKDFWTLYTPLRLHLLAAVMKFFGESILTERIYFATFPLIGSIAYYLLAKLLTNSTILSLLVTAISISSHAVGERNSLYILTLYLFASSIFVVKRGNKSQPRALAPRYLFTSGICAAFAFLMSQEFGVYAIGGIGIMTILYGLIHKIFWKQTAGSLIQFGSGVACVLLPFTLYLSVYDGIGNFIQYVFLDFSNGSYARLWVDLLPPVYVLPVDQWFGDNGYLVHPIIQTYLFMYGFIALCVISTVAAWKYTHHPLLEKIVFISLFAVANLRGLFYSQTLERRQGIFVYFFLILALIDAHILRSRIRRTISTAPFILLCLALVHWYAISLSSIPEFLNSMGAMISVSRRPQGILLDHPRVGIRVYPINIDEAVQKYYTLTPLALLLPQQVHRLTMQVDTSNDVYSFYADQFRALGSLLISLRLRASDITRRSPELTARITAIDEKIQFLQQRTALLDVELVEFLLSIQAELDQHSIIDASGDARWFKLLKQKRTAIEARNTIGNLLEYYAFTKDAVSMETLQSELSANAWFMDTAQYLATGSGTSAFGLPTSPALLFIADKENATGYALQLSNISAAQQREMISSLEAMKPCRGVRLLQFEDRSLPVKTYLPILWRYVDATYTIVDTKYGYEYLELPSCKK